MWRTGRALVLSAIFVLVVVQTVVRVNWTERPTQHQSCLCIIPLSLSLLAPDSLPIREPAFELHLHARQLVIGPTIPGHDGNPLSSLVGPHPANVVINQ